MPGRVTNIDDVGVNMRVSEGPGRYGWYDLSIEAFDSAWRGSESARTAGTYVEIIRWTTGKEEILAHPPARPDPDLPKLLPPPTRYLRALGRDVPPGS